LRRFIGRHTDDRERGRKMNNFSFLEGVGSDAAGERVGVRILEYIDRRDKLPLLAWAFGCWNVELDIRKVVYEFPQVP
jgi:hypothetical protein